MGVPTLLLTGARGLLGSVLLRQLSAAGHRVLTFTERVENQEAVKRYGSALSSDSWIIHCAALTDVKRCESERTLAYRTHVDGTRHLRDEALRSGARLLYISTASVFDGGVGNYRETDLPYPRAYYDLTKYLGEQIVAEAPRGLIVRTNVIGVHPSGSRGRNFVEWLVDSFHLGKDISLYTDARINPLCAWTIADLIQAVIKRPPSMNVVHFGSRDVQSKAQIGDYVRTRFKQYQGTVTHSLSPAGTGRPLQMWLNTDQTARQLGLTMPSLSSELERIFNQPPFHGASA